MPRNPTELPDPNPKTRGLVPGQEFDLVLTRWPVRVNQKGGGPARPWEFTRLQMIIDILSISAMSAEPEQMFSGAQRTISWDKMQLEQEIIEKIECLKSWMRQNIAVGALNIELDEALDDQID